MQSEADYYSSKKFATKAIHSGQPADSVTGAVIFPLSFSTTFKQPAPGEHLGYEYSRTGNPTRNAFEANVAALENAKHGIAFASGSATTASIIHLLEAGDHVVSVDDVYGGTYRYFTKIASKFDVSFSFVDFNDEGKLEAAITEKTKLIWLESPTNPLLKISDIAAVAKIAKAKNITFVVDNTFMSPYFQNPLDLGADIVVHSVTKFLNGHSDVVMGILATNDDSLYDRLKFIQNGIGAVPSPFDSWLAMRGSKTLHIRMREHESNAKKICEFLGSFDLVERVVYPGLESHPQHELAKKQMRGFGGMITFFLKGGLPEARNFLKNLKIFALAESLGGVESLVELPSIMTHASIPPEERAKLGITDNLVRLSCGIEDADDLIADLKFALENM